MGNMDRQTLTALVATNPARALADAKDGWRTGEVATDLALEIIAAANEALASATEASTPKANPFTAEMLANDAHMGSHREVALIVAENGTETMTCECGSTAWYKHTIGTHKCRSCGLLHDRSTNTWF